MSIRLRGRLLALCLALAMFVSVSGMVMAKEKVTFGLATAAKER